MIEYTSLCLNGRTYDKAALLQLVHTSEDLPTWQESLYQFIKDWLSEATYVEVQTSGSTGTPKRIRLEKERMIASAKMTGNYFNFSKGQKALLCLPCDYIAGKMIVVRAFVWGWNLQVVPPTGNPLKDKKSQIDFAAMVPMQVATVLEESPEQFDLLSQLIIGGGKVGQQLYKALQDLPTACYATYGMTETITHIAIQILNGRSKSPLFLALPHVHLSLDTRNCLVIDAPALNTEKVITNDIVDLRTNTSFEWLGRFDNVINSGGVKVFPEQIEKKVESIIKSRFFISFLASQKLGQQVILIIESPPWENAQLASFQTKIKLVLSKYELPKQIFFLEKFTETPTGKIQRNATKEQLLLS